jgi:protein PhnA
MSKELLARCGGKCELCSAESELSECQVPESDGQSDSVIMLCSTCNSQVEAGAEMDTNHWRCLNDSMWSAVAAVQIMAWRLLKRLDNENWAQDLLDMLYLEDDNKAWAEAGVTDADDDSVVVHKDSNGVVLSAGDTVVIIKDLNVKGTSFVAKRGTSVRGISLTSNPEHIEGRVNGTRIVILTCFVKKS